MPFNINDFRAKINKLGLAKSNLFEVRITPPMSLSQYRGEDISLMCKSVEIPALDVSTYETKPYTYGPTERRPNGLEFPILPTTFMIDERFNSLDFFREWSNKIVTYNSANASFIVQYKTTYTATIEVIVYSGNSEYLKQKYTFYNAYPVTVGAITVDWGNDAEIMVVPVGFTYDNINIETLTE